MTDENPQATGPKDTGDNAARDRIAKVMARAGVASRREAERMIVEGRVTVNGKVIDSPALDVLPFDRITVDGKKLEEPQQTRLWLYYKPIGLVTSQSDEKGRQTIFDALPRDLPRVMTVGRLDLNSEGLLLLTNDGELKRQLELPSTGWLRRYRVRVNGQPSDLTFAPLRRGATVEGEEFAPMEIRLDSQQGANAWLTVGIREGKNREIRRAMSHVGLQVNRLIRIGYGPFKLTGLEKNEVTEVKRRVLRDQLGGLLTGEATEKERDHRPHGADRAQKPRRPGAAQDGRPARAERPVKDGARVFGGTIRRDDDRPQRPYKPREDGAGPRPDKPARAGGWQEKRAAGGRDAAGEERAGRPSRHKPSGKPAFARSAEGDARRDAKPRTEGGKNERSRSEAGNKRGSAPAKHDRSGDRPTGGKPFASRSGSGGKGPTGARQDGSQKFRGKTDAAGAKGGARGRPGDASGRGGPSGKPRGPRPDGKGRGPRP